jgi:hypothetical protein
MFRHLVLGLLRDGGASWAFRLLKEYRRRAGVASNAGNFNRELKNRLAPRGYVRREENPDGADPRRVPYGITDAGRAAFDEWWLHARVSSPESHEDELSIWALFIHLFPPDVVRRVLAEKEQELWWRGKQLERDHESTRNSPPPRDQALPVLELLLTKRLREVAAALEFLEELRNKYEAWLPTVPGADPPSPPAGGPVSAPASPRTRPTPKR